MEYETPEPASIRPQAAVLEEPPARPAADPGPAAAPCPHRLRAADLRGPWRLAFLAVFAAHVLSGAVRVAALFTAGVLLAIGPIGDGALTAATGAMLLLGAALTCVGDLAFTRVRRRLHRPHRAVLALTLAGLALYTAALALIGAWLDLHALLLLALPAAVVLAALWLLERRSEATCDPEAGPPKRLARIFKATAVPSP